MAQQSLYRRYRPRRFGEIKGQEHVVRALRNAVASESEGHAYLFSGPRGTGKTSTARILAKALNCTNLTEGEPCCECESCVSIENGKSFDLFELDAASNNGVDAVRELVERSAVSSPGRTKVYILDEVHMLTPAASNALLKTLEEPPDHVRFVLATTDPQKVLPTIRSRTQHYEFFLLSADELSEHVRWVAKDAGLEIDEDGVAHAVRQGKGSVRDTLSALDQVVAAGGVMARSEPVDKLFEAIAGADAGVAVVAVADAIAQGHDPRVLGEAFLGSVRDAFLVSLGADTPHLVDADRESTSQWAAEIGTAGLTRVMERIGQSLVDMRTAADPRVPLEVALVQLTSVPTGTVGNSEDRSGDSTASAAVGASDLAEVTSRLDRIEAKLRASKQAPSEERPARAASPAEPVGRPESSPAPAVEASGIAEAPAAAEAKSRERNARPAAERAQQRPARPSGRSAPPPPPPRRRGAGLPAQSSKPASAVEPGGAVESGVADTPKVRTEDTPRAAAAAKATQSGASPVAASDDTPDRDAIVMAFGDAVVPKLKGVAKAIYSGGRFLAVTGGTAVFALDNPPTVDRAEKYRQAVEELLSEQLGASVLIRLVTEADADSYPVEASTATSAADVARKARGATGEGTPGAVEAPPAGESTAGPSAERTIDAPDQPAEPPSDGHRQDTAGSASADPEDEAELVARVDDLEDADVATRGVDKLTEAFPGAELLQTEENQ